MMLASLNDLADEILPELLDRKLAINIIQAAEERLRKKHEFLLYAHPEHPGKIFLACKENPIPTNLKMIRLTTTGVGTLHSARVVAKTQGHEGILTHERLSVATEQKRRRQVTPYESTR
jgi:hypothetical protein